MNRIIDNILKYSIMVMVYATLLTPFIVSGSLYFPYITGKAHMLRLFIEIGFALYIVLAVRSREFLPKKNPLTWAALIFTVILGFATYNAEDSVRSFWSNFERMEGYVHVLHMFAFFLMTTAVFKTRGSWFALLNTSLGLSIIMGIQGFMEYSKPHQGTLRIAGPLGNSTYLGVYALIHVFIAFFLLFKSLDKKKLADSIGWVSTYALLIIWNIIVLFNTGTRGSMVGLFAGVVFTSILIAIFERKRVGYRKTAIGLLATVFIIVALLGSFKDTSFIKSNNLLNRFASLIRWDVASVITGEGHARTLLWTMASKGVVEKPLLGWGQDNFGYVFSKYYDPKMYDQEQWFDRTHNVFFDWLIAGGILGLLSYLSLFAALLYIVWSKKEADGEWDVAQKATLTGLFVAYFVHNLFVFDNLASYILCFMLFAYIASRYDNPTNTVVEKYNPTIKNEFAQIFIALLVTAGLVYSINVVVYKPYMAGKLLIDSLEEQTYDKAVLGTGVRNKTSRERIDPLKQALALNTFGNTEIREKIIDIAISIIGKEKDPAILEEVNKFVQDQYAIQFKLTPNDSRPFIFYSTYLERIGQYEQAEKAINRAVELSPTKQSFLYQKASILLDQRKSQEGALVLKQAYDLEPTNIEARTLYALGLVFNKQFADASSIIGTSTQIISDKRLMQAYIQSGNFVELARIVKIKVDNNPEDAQAHVSLAGVYLKIGRTADAIAEIRNAIKIEPKFKTQGEYYITEIQAGRDPSGDSKQK